MRRRLDTLQLSRRKFSRHFIPDVVPEVTIAVFLQELPGRVLASNGHDDTLTKEPPLMHGEAQVQALVVLDQGPPTYVANVRVRSCVPSTQDVMRVNLWI
jgi:hypothetical protein